MGRECVGVVAGRVREAVGVAGCPRYFAWSCTLTAARQGLNTVLSPQLRQ